MQGKKINFIIWKQIVPDRYTDRQWKGEIKEIEHAQKEKQLKVRQIKIRLKGEIN